MKPFVVLIVSFLLSLLVIKFSQNDYNIALAARIAMSIMLVFTSIAHFAFTKGMSMMMPSFIPFKTALVYITGLFEIAAAFGLQIKSLHHLTGWLLIAFFILLLPANINAAVKHVDYEKGNYEGSGVRYLWFRVPLQVLFILWVYISAFF